MVIEAIRLLEARVTNASDIDKTVRLGFNFPLGPLEIADSMGLDTLLEASEFLREKKREIRGFGPPPLLRRMVRGGLLGRKTDRGFYVYEEVGRVNDLFRPVRIGGLALKNRAVMPAMGTGYGTEGG